MGVSQEVCWKIHAGVPLGASPNMLYNFLLFSSIFCMNFLKDAVSKLLELFYVFLGKIFQHFLLKYLEFSKKSWTILNEFHQEFPQEMLSRAPPGFKSFLKEFFANASAFSSVDFFANYGSFLRDSLKNTGMDLFINLSIIIFF